MTDHLHPALDIPGGLWRGAIVEVHSIGMTLTIVSMAGGGAHVEGHRGPWDLADLSLRLDDPLGLGLAGLAARVAERLLLHWTVTDGLEGLTDVLCGPPWARSRWEEWHEDDRFADVIREAATLLARLDRLVAQAWPAGECRCLPGAVPTWERGLAGGLTPAWLLTCGPCGVAAWLLTDHPGLDTPDPIEAAGAALEVCGG